VNIPGDLKYTESHEWVRVEGDVATIGITDHAQQELGDIVYIDLQAAGRVLKPGDSFGTVESVKTVADVYAPVGGEVIEANPALGGQAELVNSDPYGDGWMVKIRMSGDSKELMDAPTYRAALGV
jgi:glycine cleavage system H protein